MKIAYKKAMTHSQAVDIFRKSRGTHFDPDMVDAFLELEDEFRQIAMKFNDGDLEPGFGAVRG